MSEIPIIGRVEPIAVRVVLKLGRKLNRNSSAVFELCPSVLISYQEFEFICVFVCSLPILCVDWKPRC